ncbi:MAG TPA: POTRA domain-containing protein [Candidatus Acidoferrum sp.]|jgi:outer membrane protein assembly factor BamA|nr:POTRA domain-containing protein [Candidatus Acidoferrum sp.]
MRFRGTNTVRALIALALLLGAAPAYSRPHAPQAASASEAAANPVVVSVRIVREDGQVLLESPSGIAVETGKPLDREKVAESLRALYRTGDYADLRAVVSPEKEGVRLDFVARENLFFNAVRLNGLEPPPSEASAVAAMQIGLGQTYRKEIVDAALERLRETLRDEGLYRAEVSAETVPHPETHQMDIIVHVKPGPRARVASIQLKNDTAYRDATLLSRFKMKAGQAITSARSQHGTERVRKFLAKKGHLSARVSVRRGEFDAAKNTAAIFLEVTQGPRVEVSVSGAKFSEGELKRLIPIYQEGAVDTDLLEEGKRNIRERLERQGYFDADVSYKIAMHDVKTSAWQGTQEAITYTAERGDKHKLVGIEISGNKYFDTELLKSRLQIFQGAFGSPGRFSRRLVDLDAQSMQSLYQANGFLDARVIPWVEDNYKGREGDLFISFTVEEGKQTRVASLSIEGIHAFKEEELLGVVGSTPGQPYSDFGVSTDRDNILALYFNEGFPEATFTATAEPAPATAADDEASPASRHGSPAGAEKKEPSKKEVKPPVEQADEVRLVYRIQEGPQIRVRRVLISGYEHTRPGVIRREVRIKPEQPLREGDVVESQRRLYNLGVFNRVTIEPQNPNGTNTDKDIAVLVEEAKRYTLAYGGGFEVQRLASTTNPTAGQVQAAPRGILEISKLNLTGRADTLSFKLRGSTLQGRALLGYSAPNTFGNSKLSFQATVFAEKTRDINTFTQQRYEGSVQLTDQVTALSSIFFRYAFRQVQVSDLKIPPQEIPLFNQPTLVSQFGVTWVRDSRNNPADASKGTFNSADFDLASTYIGSSASFLRFFYQNSSYHPIKRRFSFARSIRMGVLAPYRDTVSLSFPAPTTPPLPTVIPLPERFFAGGGTSLRGFALNQAGPRDSITGFPVGGQAVLMLNQEFRFPMRLPFIGTSLGGALFYDGGNVYSRLSRVSFRTFLPAPTFALQNPSLPPSSSNVPMCVTHCSNELNYFSHTVGFGFRYKTPVGPIRIDLGYQLNRPLFVVPIPCPSNAPTSGPNQCQSGSLGQMSTRLSGFQIFFNLGSTF